MDRRFPVPGGWLAFLLYAFQIVALVLVLLFVVAPLDGLANALLAALFVALVVATVVGTWRASTDGDTGTHTGTAEDITYDPYADPGQAAKDRWQRAIDRLPGGDDED